MDSPTSSGGAIRQDAPSLPAVRLAFVVQKVSDMEQQEAYTPETAPRRDSVPDHCPVPEEEVIAYFDTEWGLYPSETQAQDGGERVMEKIPGGMMSFRDDLDGEEREIPIGEDFPTEADLPAGKPWSMSKSFEMESTSSAPDTQLVWALFWSMGDFTVPPLRPPTPLHRRLSSYAAQFRS